MMNESDFKRYRSLFGQNPDSWPMPQRLEAQEFLKKRPDSSSLQDQAIFDAALLETDEAALARSVLARINAPRPVGWLERFTNNLMPKPMLTGFSVLLVCASVAGYHLPIGAQGAEDMQVITTLVSDGSGLYADLDIPFTSDDLGIE